MKTMFTTAFQPIFKRAAYRPASTGMRGAAGPEGLFA